METVRSYIAGQWVSGTERLPLYNPSTGEKIGELHSGVDTAAALADARERGGQALREMSFRQRGAMLQEAARAIHGARDALLDLAMVSGGNTRGDAKFDIDGAMATLGYYAELGAKLGDATGLCEEILQLGRAPRWVGTHFWSPLRGVAVHINAFNFPAWNYLEKAAVAWLAGMPVLTKPATSTALVAARISEVFIEKNFLPAGALNFLAGTTGTLLEQLTGQDAVAFTGSHATSLKLRGPLGAAAVRFNVEADSLNAAVLGADVSDETYDSFLRDVVREMTQKSGQKCTAVRRIFVPESELDRVCADLREALVAIKVGDPREDGVKMGPLASAEQQRSVQEGVKALAQEAELVLGDGGRGGAPAQGYFAAPVLLKGGKARVHDLEVFGPVASVLSYGKEVAAQVARGQGSLVASVYADDAAFVEKFFTDVAPFHGRVFWGSAKTADQALGSGAVLASLMHGGPGRAGGGSELGGAEAMRLYLQRTALSGPRPQIEKMQARYTRWETAHG